MKDSFIAVILLFLLAVVYVFQTSMHANMHPSSSCSQPASKSAPWQGTESCFPDLFSPDDISTFKVSLMLLRKTKRLKEQATVTGINCRGTSKFCLLPSSALLDVADCHDGVVLQRTGGSFKLQASKRMGGLLLEGKLQCKNRDNHLGNNERELTTCECWCHEILCSSIHICS